MATKEPCSSSSAPPARAGVRRRRRSADAGGSEKKRGAPVLRCVRQAGEKAQQAQQAQQAPPVPPIRGRSGSQPLRGDEVGSDASLGSRNLNGAVAEAHIHWIFFNLSYMSLYMRILCNLFNRMRSATTDALTGEEKGEEPLKTSLNPTANKTTYSYTWTWSITAREWNALMKAMHGNGTHRVEWGPRALVWLLLILLACPSGARAWMWCVLTAVMGIVLAGWRVRKERGVRQPSSTTESATRHNKGPTKPAGSPSRAKPEDAPRRKKRSEKARRRARKRKCRRRRPAPRGCETWTRAEVAVLPIRAKKRRVWAWKRHRRNVRRKERGKLDPDLAFYGVPAVQPIRSPLERADAQAQRLGMRPLIDEDLAHLGVPAAYTWLARHAGGYAPRRGRNARSDRIPRNTDRR